ncbi:MAG: hypothetical protein ACNA8S_13425 [Deferrisomatales bacterium]
MAAVYSEGRPPSADTAEEIMKRLQILKNYVPSSSVVHREYAHVLFETYQGYVVERRQADT